jgi:hypothetical protein
MWETFYRKRGTGPHPKAVLFCYLGIRHSDDDDEERSCYHRADVGRQGSPDLMKSRYKVYHTADYFLESLMQQRYQALLREAENERLIRQVVGRRQRAFNVPRLVQLAQWACAIHSRVKAHRSAQ